MKCLFIIMKLIIKFCFLKHITQCYLVESARKAICTDCTGSQCTAENETNATEKIKQSEVK